MSRSVTTPPTGEVIELQRAKLHLRVDTDEDDDLIKALIVAARMHVEAVCERALMDQVWTERTEAFSPRIELRGGKVSAINAITYVAEDGQAQVIDPATCVVDLLAQPAILMAPYGSYWPRARRMPGSISIAYTVGYGTADDVPAPIVAAMLLIIGDLYENRSQQQAEQLFTNAASDALLWPYRRVMP